jgi:hypothetical protein
VIGFEVSMSASRLAIFVVAALLAGAPKAPDSPSDPKLVSIHPFTGQRGAAFVATVRGSGLRDATSVFIDNAPFTAIVEGAEPDAAGKPGKTSVDGVRLRIQVEANAKPGRYPFRLVTPRGISNALQLHILDLPVAAEPEGSHETPDTAVSVEKLPVVFNGRIGRRGETDYYAFDVTAGQTLTFEAISGLSSIGAAGGNAVGFDPSISIFEPSGSWFDPKRINRIAFNDEPLWVIGRLTDAYLVHKFAKPGRYLLRIEAFSGQGGPDYSYQLKIIPGEAPQDQPPPTESWEERAFPRRLSADRLNQLAERGGKLPSQKSIETYRGPAFKIPGTLEGDLTHAGETHRASFHLDSPQDIAIEIETPDAAPPLFNPIVRLLDAAGQEVATNVFAGRGACNGEMNKSLQSKTIIPLRDTGDYTIEIRDITSDLAGPGFRYRVQVRPQVPHIGQVKIDEDHINLAPGNAKTVRVGFDREEGYSGAVAVSAESLPPGVEALAGADFEPDKDPPRFPGKRERYTPRTEHSVVVFTASSDAALMNRPQLVRIVLRPLTGGKLGAIVGTKSIPFMVAKP